jgi:cellulose synthase/poly-beta-1,6-N-acetylglucosamine synthase-like glycosyltransferase
MTVDGVVPVYAETNESLNRTVDGLVAQTRAPDRILVVDDGSPDRVRPRKDLITRAEVLRLPTNSGIAAARNAAASRSTADFLLFVNCDVVLVPFALETALEFMESQPATGVVGGPIVPVVGSLVLRRWRLRFLENPEQRVNREQPVTWLTAHAYLVRRAAYDAVGGFEERYTTTGEDYEFCQAVLGAGYRVFHLPRFAAHSYEAPSIELFARKCLRHSGFDTRPGGRLGKSDSSDRVVQLGLATRAVLRDFANHAGRDLARRRFTFLPIDVAVAAQSLAILWGARRSRRDSARPQPYGRDA